MMKQLAGVLLMMSAQAFGNASPADDRIEICVSSGACAIPVYALGYEGTVYVVRTSDDLQALAQEWTGAQFYLTTETDYKAVRDEFTTETVILRGRTAPPPAPAPKGGGSGPGPLIGISTGPITIGGTPPPSAGCADCHDGNWKEIHSGVLKKSREESGK